MRSKVIECDWDLQNSRTEILDLAEILALKNLNLTWGLMGGRRRPLGIDFLREIEIHVLNPQNP